MKDNLLEEVFSIIDNYSGDLSESKLIEAISDNLWLNKTNAVGKTFEEKVMSLMEAREKLLEYKVDALALGAFRRIKDNILGKGYDHAGEGIQLMDIFAQVADLGSNSVSFGAKGDSVIPFCTATQLIIDVFNIATDPSRTKVIALPAKIDKDQTRILLFKDGNKYVKPIALGSLSQLKEFLLDINKKSPWNENIFQFMADVAKSDPRLSNLPVAPDRGIPKVNRLMVEEILPFQLSGLGNYGYLKKDILKALEKKDTLNLCDILQTDLFGAIRSYVNIPAEKKIETCKNFISLLKNRSNNEEYLQNVLNKKTDNDFYSELSRRQNAQKNLSQSNLNFKKAQNKTAKEYAFGV